jgi:hypothetical protein
MSKEHVYDTQIAPLMTQIIAVCKMHGIAMLASYAIHGPEGAGSEDDLYCTTHLPAELGIYDPVLARATQSLGIRRLSVATIKTVEPDGKTTITAVMP